MLTDIHVKLWSISNPFSPVVAAKSRLLRFLFNFLMKSYVLWMHFKSNSNGSVRGNEFSLEFFSLNELNTCTYSVTVDWDIPRKTTKLQLTRCPVDFWPPTVGVSLTELELIGAAYPPQVESDSGYTSTAAVDVTVSAVCDKLFTFSQMESS